MAIIAPLSGGDHDGAELPITNFQLQNIKVKMKTKIKTKNKNKTKIKSAVFLFFALAQMGQADISSGSSIIAQDMLELTNGSRIEAGLAPLAINEKLAMAAREKADDMFKSQYFDHNNPSGKTPWDFIKSAGYEYGYAGENLAIDFISASGAHKALMESSSHRDNILNMNYTEIGIAVKEDIFEGNKSIIIVEEFASPLYIEKTSDYNLNENIELILEEKTSEINNLPKKEEEIIAESLEARADISVIENKNVLDIEDDILSSGLENVSILYYLKEDAFEKWIPSLFPNEGDFAKKIVAENNDQEADKPAVQSKPILLAENLNNERIMGLASEVSFKEEYLNKFKYQTSSSLNGYFQDELSARILLLNLFLAILLIIDFWFIVRIDTRHLMPEIN